MSNMITADTQTKHDHRDTAALSNRLHLSVSAPRSVVIPAASVASKVYYAYTTAERLSHQSHRCHKTEVRVPTGDSRRSRRSELEERAWRSISATRAPRTIPGTVVYIFLAYTTEGGLEHVLVSTYQVSSLILTLSAARHFLPFF